MHIIAHRGGSEGLVENENQLDSVLKSIALSIEMVEVDLRFDGARVVLSHDPLLGDGKYTTLLDVLEEVAGKKVLNLEIKELGVVAPLAKMLTSYSGKILLSSFDYQVLKLCRELLPKYELAVLEKWSGVRATRRAKKLNTKRLHMNQRWLWGGFIRAMRASGYELYAYTVNTAAQANSFKRAGITGIFTDFPKQFTQ